MKFLERAVAVAIAVAGRNAVASILDPDVGEGFRFRDRTVESAVKKLVQVSSPTESILQVDSITAIQETTAGSMHPTSGGYFAPFGFNEPPEALYRRNGSLARLAPIINVAAEALNQPIPTNKWWGNLIHITALNTSENFPAWAQPYAFMLPRVPPYGLMAYYPYTYREMAPEINGTVQWYSHGVHNDLTFSALGFNETRPTYEVYSWSDVGIKLRLCDRGTTNCIDSALLSGMAFVSATYNCLTPRIDTEHNITYVDELAPGKFAIYLNNNQTWMLYASDTSLSLRVEDSVTFSVNASGSSLVADDMYSGTIRVAVLPEGAPDTLYDDYVSCIVRGGTVSMESRTQYSLHWDAVGSSCDTVGLLHFALPHHVESMIDSPITAETPGAITLRSTTRGLMVGQVSMCWSFCVPEADMEIDFYPAQKPTPFMVQETDMLRTLQDDILANWTMATNSWYFNGKALQKYASLCLMAADSTVVGSDTTLLALCIEKLERLFEPLLNNTMSPPLVYETLYGGVVSGFIFDTDQLYMDFGSGIYNDHHYHFGYYVMSAAILKYLDPTWYLMPELDDLIWMLLRDVTNPSLDDPVYTRFRHFSWFHGHSYSRGVTLLDHGKDQESTSEDLNFYCGMTLWGRETGHKVLEDLGSLMLRLNAHSVREYFLLSTGNKIHPPEIVRNRVTGIFFDNKVYYNTWFLNEKYAIHGIQMIPFSPVSPLARTSAFVTEEWNDILSKEPIVTMKNSNNTWLSVLLVNAAVVNKMDSLYKLMNATMDDGLTRSWALYMAATAG
ncbi:unnamed protein product [Hyaloperonospora brassicae]|uniref:glucan endo-1,3-beta-D-glucosidase n=1 Tax=Hyaloperonospora brassicae TaxID=162125 RepID=A0AAV0T285_HYABA|nr:unnamed protein product [Hyaloperonospora brassicae]